MKEYENKENDIDCFIRQAYNRYNTEDARECYKEDAIRAIIGTYYSDLCKKAQQLIYKYKDRLKPQVYPKDATYKKKVSQSQIKPEDVVHDFIIKKLYEKDALSDYLNRVYNHIIAFLYTVLKNYFIDAYTHRPKQSDLRKKEDTLQDNLYITNSEEGKNEGDIELEEELKEEYQKKPVQLSEEFNIDVLGTKKGKEKSTYSFIDDWHETPKNRKDSEDEEEITEYQKKLDELSEKYPLEVKLLLELSKKDLVYIKDPSELYNEYNMGEKSIKKFYIKKGAYIEIVKEEGQFHYTNILENHGEGLEKLVLPDNKITFVLTNEEMIEKAIEVQKKNIEKSQEENCPEKEEIEIDYTGILEKYGTNLKKVTFPDGKISFRLSEKEMIKRATDFLKQRMHRFFMIIEKEKNLLN
ncbi:MAG: hypothetical protein E3K37_02470 [Candidatus Kuenenia sp.]|nr:hypothetical protein [Candidatus Kuenenia hertensis]